MNSLRYAIHGTESYLYLTEPYYSLSICFDWRINIKALVSSQLTSSVGSEFTL